MPRLQSLPLPERMFVCFLCLLAPIADTTARAQEDNLAARSAENTPLSQSRAHAYVPGRPRGKEKLLVLAPGPNLFIDDFLIADSENITREVIPPQRDSSIPNPIITGKEDGCFQPYMTVIQDPETHIFRIWFGHRKEDSDTSGSHVATMTSNDGMHWKRPAQILKDPAPIQFGASVIDEGPRFNPPEDRFRLAWWKDGGMKVAASPDGVIWHMLAEDTVLRHNHDITSIYRDSARDRYMATISVYRTGDKWSGQRRITMQSYSGDLLHWSEPHYILMPEDGPDPGETQFYAMDGFLNRGDLIVGMVKVLRDDLKADSPPVPHDAYGIGYTSLAWSRDGETWFRDREHFLDPDPAPDAWDHAHAWIDEQVLVGNEVYLYYGGYQHGHKVNRFEERQIGLIKIKQDRYVARTAGAAVGRLRTPLLRINADELAINANARDGWIKAQLLDENGAPMPGFAMEDCKPITEDAISSPLQWRQPFRKAAASSIRIEFVFQNARLFAFNTFRNQ